MDKSQTRAIANYRARLSERGLARFEVLGLRQDRELIRSLARQLAENNAEAAALRATVLQTVTGAAKGGILAALRRSPLVEAGLELTRERENGRTVEL